MIFFTLVSRSGLETSVVAGMHLLSTLNELVESKTRTYQGQVTSGRTAWWRGGVGQD